MPIIDLTIGNSPVLTIPFGAKDRRHYGPRYSKRVAREYAHGEFSLGRDLTPAEHPEQKLGLADADVNDFIAIDVVPQQHLISSILLDVVEPDSRMAGAQVKPVAYLYDSADGSYTRLDLLDDLFTAQALDSADEQHAMVTEEDGAGDAVIKPYFVEKGTSVLLGYEVIAMPTDTTVKLSAGQFVVRMVSKVHGYDSPTLA